MTHIPTRPMKGTGTTRRSGLAAPMRRAVTLLIAGVVFGPAVAMAQTSVEVVEYYHHDAVGSVTLTLPPKDQLLAVMTAVLPVPAYAIRTRSGAFERS
jgi:hypothetical protein